MEYGYIYKTTNLLNGKIYIGQHKGLLRSYYLGSGRTIAKAIKKYSRENFRLEVLAFATTKAMLDGLEMKYIFEYRQVYGNEFLYNISDGGKGIVGIIPWNKGLKKDTDARVANNGKKIGNSQKGQKRPHSREWREAIGKAMRGNKNALKTK